MTMEDEHDTSTVESFPLHILLYPILDEMQQTDVAASQTLRAAFNKMEKKKPGFTKQLIHSILEAKSKNVNLTESLLKLAALDSEEYTLTRREDKFIRMNQQARSLKAILARLPDQYANRPVFLQTIKDIACGIKDLLGALNTIFKDESLFRDHEQRKTIETYRKEFIHSSKDFSLNLKNYFRVGNITEVYESATHLIHHINLILKLLKTI
ncbi:programmed cell death protein 10-like [Lytechinus pictus]|uniref:programmed cell death protein 10-like n=1 Tax=Lytechinus pictus TaxID=7653 RepID=UPI00240E7994|nr:programmed cell death protein 10-like [Lytechinus pictus]